MRWPGGFGPGQLWWREAFYCAVSLYVWPLPEYKSWGRALKGPARASLPHTALQAILTQVRTHRHWHSIQSTGPTPCPSHPGKPPSAWGKTQADTQGPNEPPTLNSRPNPKTTQSTCRHPWQRAPHDYFTAPSLLCDPVTSIYTSISVHPLVLLHLSPRLSWSPSPCLRLPSPPPARAPMPRTREPPLPLPPARPPRPASLAWDPTEWVTVLFYFRAQFSSSKLQWKQIIWEFQWNLLSVV